MKHTDQNAPQISLAIDPTLNLDPVMVSFLPKHIVAAALKGNGARFVKVTFAKKSGEVTTRVGRPKTYSRRVGGINGPEANPATLRRAQIATKALLDHGNIWMDYPKVGEDGKLGFSFNLGRVVAIARTGEHDLESI